jgi:hypothetical protein
MLAFSGGLWCRREDANAAGGTGRLGADHQHTLMTAHYLAWALWVTCREERDELA